MLQHRGSSYLYQTLEDAFQDLRKCLQLLVDFKQACDKVWKKGLAVKLGQCGINGNKIRWIQSNLHNRRTRVRPGGLQSKKV